MPTTLADEQKTEEAKEKLKKESRINTNPFGGVRVNKPLTFLITQ